ncbi:MAG: hypothetical protein PHF67_03555 [Candidatus Nanoarchaeia archaeon]|nr:hypothetical protein [Candidatus Nanoarchaeia archaeon]
MKRKYFNKKASTSYLEILILVISTFAIAYIIGSAIQDVDATAVPGYGCCEETINGNSCQYVPQSECNLNFVPTECSETSYCKKGCCISKETGFCGKNSAERDCGDGIWKDDLNCNYQECRNICCIIGEQGLWTTEKNCEIESLAKGKTANINRNVKTDIECTYLAGKTDKGACVFYSDDVKKCVYTTREECYSKTKNLNAFYKNNYCSNTELNTTCKARNNTGCVEEKESVYWFDSCGNPEVAYQNCSVLLGSICGKYREGLDKKPLTGEYACRDLSCKVKINGEDAIKRNGESWCEYDGTIGDGKDVVGSRHIKHMCFMGEEKIEPCRDYRNDICVQQDTEISDGSIFSESACRVNNWRSCFEYNTLEDKSERTEKCQKNPDCFIKKVDVDEYFKFDFCVPKYPPGFDLRGNSGLDAQLVCGFGSASCTYKRQKTLFSKEEANANCLSPEFAEKMNDFCVSLGDCGAYVNYNGDVNDEGYKIINSPKLSNTHLVDLEKYSLKNPNQNPAEVGDLNFTGVLGKPENLGQVPEEEDGLGKFIEKKTGQVGVITLVNMLLTGETASMLVPSISEFAVSLAPFLNAATTMLAGASVGVTIAKLMGLKDPLSISLISSSGALSAILASTSLGGLSFAGWGAFLFSALYPLLIAAIASYIVAQILKWLGVGKVTTIVVEFKCMPWQPPNGGENCGACGKDEVPCTDYRCRTLGKTCELINKGTENEVCVNNPPKDITSPNIKPLYGIISNGYEYYNEIEGKDGSFEIVNSADQGCVDSYKNIVFGIKTLDSEGKDKPAICKFGTDPTQDYDDMDFFGGMNLNLVNHTMILNIPPPEAFANQYNLSDEQIRELGEVKFYVKCQSLSGQRNLVPYTIKTCVKPEEDLTAPIITKTVPENNAFVKNNLDEKSLSLFVNEPSNCKFSREDKSYDEMENTAECSTLLEQGSINGWECRTNLTGLINNKKFYFKCKDISKNNNVMAESFVYELSSTSNLVINSVTPADNSVINSGVEPANLNLRVITSGGAEDGKSICSWKGNGYSDRFIENSNEHSYNLNSATRGSYNVSFICEDVAGNKVETSSSFKIYIDILGPKIIKVFSKNGLNVITNEKAECRYTFNEKTVFENSTLMSGYDLEHTANWQSNTYYVQCKDSYGNKGDRVEIRTYN